MTIPKTIDQNLRQFATERQWEKLEATVKHGSYGAAAKAMQIDRRGLAEDVKSIFKKAARQGYAPEHGLTHPMPDGLTLSGTSQRFNEAGTVDQQWIKSKVQGRDDSEVQHVPDPKTIVGVSTLYDQSGQVTQQWVKERPEDIRREAAWREFARELASELPRSKPLKGPKQASDTLLACYPVGDHHFGMLAWAQEAGEDYDLRIAEQLLTGAIDYLVEATPACEKALIAFLGDLVHIDSLEAVTPTSRNLLDADGRFPKMIQVAIRSMRYLIAAALRRHQHVHVIVEIGNHDLSTSVILMQCLANIYENEPRVTIDTSPAHYHYYDFGSVLIGTHHGHGAKMDKLPMIMAADRPDEWGRTRHRMWLTGHIHNRQVLDFAGCTVESFRVLAATDAWAAQKGYRSIRNMHALVFHREFGEVARHTVNPEMIMKDAA